MMHAQGNWCIKAIFICTHTTVHLKLYEFTVVQKLQSLLRQYDCITGSVEQYSGESIPKEHGFSIETWNMRTLFIKPVI
jgi:hypothetical protein